MFVVCLIPLRDLAPLPLTPCIVLTVTKQNANAAMLLVFLYKLLQLFKDYFEEVEEESVRDNFVIIYELLDEIMDFGYPQITDGKVLQQYIQTGSNRMDSDEPVIPLLPSAVTGQVTWRPEARNPLMCRLPCCSFLCICVFLVLCFCRAGYCSQEERSVLGCDRAHEHGHRGQWQRGPLGDSGQRTHELQANWHAGIEAWLER